MVGSPGSRPALVEMLDAVARGTTLPLSRFGEATARWAIESGLGPILLHTTHDHAAAPTIWPLLRGAELTAKLRVADRLEAMEEILDGCNGRLSGVTLLKGISIAGQHYPAPHLRPMGDVDLLVEEADVAPLERILFELGYRSAREGDAEFYRTHHHSAPLHHPARDVWVEVHRGLFPPSTRLGAARVFGAHHVRSQVGPSDFRGRPVNRLSDEFQIVYVAAHWTFDFRVAGGMVGMLDLVCLARDRHQPVRWETILGWLDEPVVAGCVYLLLSYLARYRVVDVPDDFLSELRARHRWFGTLALGLTHELIDRYVVSGRTLGVGPERFERMWKRASRLRRSPSR